MTGLAAGIGAKLIFGNLLGGVGRGIKGAASFALANWKPLAIIGGIAAAVIYIIILHGEIRHRDKTIAGQAALIGQVKAEVDRGINGKSNAADAPFYVRRFVDNVRTLDAALTRQSAALRVSSASSDSHNAASHAAAIAPPTPVQQKREETRQQIADPKAGGLTADQWSQL